MFVLALDTSTPAVIAGVARTGDHPRDVVVLAARVTVNPRAHGELITLHATEAIGSAGLTLRDLDAIVCGVGPGPFTGLRAGMVTAAAFGQSLGVPVHPVCSLDAIAADRTDAGPLLVVTDARRREVYWARYGVTGAREAGPSVSAPADVEHEGIGSAAGYGAPLCVDPLGIQPVGPRYPTVLGLVRAAWHPLTAAQPPAPLTPLYLRKPDATVPGARKRVLA